MSLRYESAINKNGYELSLVKPPEGEGFKVLTASGVELRTTQIELSGITGTDSAEIAEKAKRHIIAEPDCENAYDVKNTNDFAAIIVTSNPSSIKANSEQIDVVKRFSTEPLDQELAA
jgi:hypothetical protein